MYISHLIIISLSLFMAGSNSDDSPGFFLKVTKNIPRLGRRSFTELGDSGLHRMNRRSEYDRQNPITNNKDLAWLMEIPTPTKRMILNSIIEDREYSVVQPVNSNTLIEMLDKDAIPSEIIRFVHWKDFDRALQNDYDLYSKIISLGRKPDHRLKEELKFSNDIQFLSNGDNLENDENAFSFYKGYSQMYPKGEQNFANLNELK